MTTTIKIFGAALLVSLALASVCQAKEAVQQHQQQHVHPSLASKLIPQPQQPKARSARSLSDMLEKVKSKIFGNRKQQASQASSSSSSSSSVSPSSSSMATGANNQLQTAASINSAQRQPWADLSSFSQQYNPYTMNYQWPSAGSSASGSNQFMMNPSYNSLGGFSMAPSSVGGLDASASQQMGSSLTPAANSNQAGQSSSATGAGSLLTSASHLIAHYLSPSSSSSSPSSSASSIGIGGSPQQSGLFNGQQSGQSINNGVQLTPQQQQAQAQYQEFASILDTMVSQTGANVQQRPQQQQQGPSISQYMQPQQPQQQPGANPMQSSGAAVMGNGPAADNDMSGSSNIQSYMPQASQQPASQKSGMVGLAEQLSPGSQFNKLVSFPFSLTSNDDPSKDGRFKLHIPFLNNHVKRSDQQAAAAAAAVAAQQSAQLSTQQKAQQQQFQQYMNNYYNQQQLYASPAVGQQQQPQQMSAQASQVVPTIVSPQTSLSSSSQQSPVSAAGAQISQSPSSSIQSSPSSSSSSSSGVPSSSSSSSSSSIQSSPSQSSSSSSLIPVGQSSNSRPAWSVSEVQSGSPSMSSSSISSASSSSSSGSSSKLIPIQSSAIPASSSIEQNTQN